MLAKRLSAEIISADSRQIYRELRIGTAKPDAARIAQVPHHLVGELGLGTPYSAGLFARQAYEIIRMIVGRSRLAMVVGSPTLNLHALQHGLSAVPETDLAVRRKLEKQLAQDGAMTPFEELCRVDSDSAARLDPTKTFRRVRALQIYRSTGVPLSHYLTASSTFTFKVVVLNMERAALYQDIDERVELRLYRGLFDEVRQLVGLGQDHSAQVLQAIGYREVKEFLQGEVCRTAMVRQIKRNSRRYAKRQLTCFRRYPDFKWIRLPAKISGISGPHLEQILSEFEVCRHAPKAACRGPQFEGYTRTSKCTHREPVLAPMAHRAGASTGGTWPTDSVTPTLFHV